MSAFRAGNYVGAPPATLVFGGFWIRVWAYLIDAIVLNVVIWAWVMATGGSFFRIDPATGVPNSVAWGLMGGSVLIPAIYTIGFWVSSAATPGKMALGLRIVDAATGGPIMAGQAIGRFFGYMISSIVFGLGFVWVGFDARKQGWHDKLASTVVVRKSPSNLASFQT